MKQEKISLSKIKPNKANPRVIKDSKFHKLVNSILVFPKMMEARPIVVNNEMVVLGGNMRLKALETIKGMDEQEIRHRLGNMTDFTLKPTEERESIINGWLLWKDKPETFVVKANEFTEAEQKQFIVKDNASFGDWDFDALTTEYDVQSLGDWGVDITAPFESGELNTLRPSEQYKSPDYPTADYGDDATPSDGMGGGLGLPSVPTELASEDIAPDALPVIEGDDEVAMERVIIVFEKGDKGKVAKLLGLEEIKDVVYRYKNLPCAE